jgi:hypothetical protein
MTRCFLRPAFLATHRPSVCALDARGLLDANLAPL